MGYDKDGRMGQDGGGPDSYSLWAPPLSNSYGKGPARNWSVEADRSLAGLLDKGSSDRQDLRSMRSLVETRLQRIGRVNDDTVS